MNNSTHDIVDFFKGNVSDKFGRDIRYFHSYNDFWLEHDHKYIQCLFPINYGTKFNNHAPMVNDCVIKLFHNDESLREIHLSSLDLMLEFYNMKRSGNDVLLISEPNIKDHVWLKAHDHNQLRLSRIIRSLFILGNKDIALGLCRTLVREALVDGSYVSSKTIREWLNSCDIN